MKKGFLFLPLLALLFIAGCASESVYIGGSDGIHKAEYGSARRMEKAADAPDISYMAVFGRSLYAARRIAKGVSGVDVFRISRKKSLSKTDAFVIPGKFGYCHISVSRDGKYLFGSSYSGGFLDVLSLIPGGGIIRLKQRIAFSGCSIHKRQTKSHPHFAAQTPDGSMLLVADLGTDRIHTFKYEKNKGFVQGKSVSLPPGSGPRHLSFSADGKFVLAANELNNTICSFKMEKGTLVPVSVCSLLPAAWSGRSYAGAIKTAPDGRIFVTNRGHDSIAVLSLSLEGKLKLENIFSSEGNFPYDMTFSRGTFLTVCMKSDKFGIWQKKDSSWSSDGTLYVRRPMCVIPVPEF